LSLRINDYIDGPLSANRYDPFVCRGLIRVRDRNEGYLRVFVGQVSELAKGFLGNLCGYVSYYGSRMTTEQRGRTYKDSRSGGGR